MVKFLHRLKAARGFTLVELIAVIAIIGVLAAILIPMLSGVIESSRKRTTEQTCASIHSLAAAYQTQYMAKKGEDCNDPANDVCDMDIEGQPDMSFYDFVGYNIPELKDKENVEYGVEWNWENHDGLVYVWYKYGNYKAEWVPNEGQKPAEKV